MTENFNQKYKNLECVYQIRSIVVKLTDCNVAESTCFWEYRCYNFLHGCLDWVYGKNQIFVVFLETRCESV